MTNSSIHKHQISEKFEYQLDPDKIYKCPICHEGVRGRRGLTIHLKRTHFKKNLKPGMQTTIGGKKDWSRKRFDPKVELKVQELVLKATYGMSMVNSVIKDYIDGKYTLKTLPINIEYYIRLKGIKPRKDDKEDLDKDQGVSQKKDTEPSPETSDQKPMTGEDLLDELLKKHAEDAEVSIGVKYSEDRFKYVEDLKYDLDENILKISTTIDTDDVLGVAEAVKYLSEYPEEIECGNCSDFVLDVSGRKVWRIYRKEKSEGNIVKVILNLNKENSNG